MQPAAAACRGRHGRKVIEPAVEPHPQSWRYLIFRAFTPYLSRTPVPTARRLLPQTARYAPQAAPWSCETPALSQPRRCCLMWSACQHRSPAQTHSSAFAPGHSTNTQGEPTASTSPSGSGPEPRAVPRPALADLSLSPTPPAQPLFTAVRSSTAYAQEMPYPDQKLPQSSCPGPMISTSALSLPPRA